MTSLGKGRFTANITPLKGETVLWEGGAAKSGLFVRAARIGVVLGLPALLLLWLFGGLLLVQPSRSKAPAIASAEASRSASPSGEPPDAAARRTSVSRTVMAFLGGLSLLVIIGVLAEAWLFYRSAWYVVTNERVCIQNGTLTRYLTVVDLDKVLSIQISTSWLERQFGLQSIEFVHGGVRVFTSSRSIVRDPLVMSFVPAAGTLTSDLLNSWLPRDNQTPSA